MNVDITSEKMVGNVSILKLPTKRYKEILDPKIPYRIVKRTTDIILSLTSLVGLLPFFAIIALAIKLDSKGPVFYRQERVTTNGKIFRIFKFRTMVQNADQIGSLVTVGNDARITRVGKVIRKVRLDEIPQLINILKGEMTFVGTRPEVKKYVDKYTDEMMATLLMPAGVTSIASIKYKDEDEILDKAVKAGKDTDVAYVEDVLPGKMKYNLEYLKQFSVLHDLKICIDTVIGVLR